MFSSKSYGLFELALSGKTTATCGWLRGADHPGAGRSPISGQFPEQIFPDSAPRPADKSVADRRRWATGRRAITPATAAFQHSPMPPMTRRSIPAQPRRHPSTSKAEIRFHCSSLGQNTFLLTISIPSRQTITILLSAQKDLWVLTLVPTFADA